MECTNCYSTMFLSVLAKCYDMCTVGYEDKGLTGYVPSGIGLGDNPNFVEFSYCMQCGKIHGDFPIQLPGAFRPPVIQPVIPEDEYVSEVLKDFYQQVMEGGHETTAVVLLRKVMKFLQPTDASILNEAWQKYEDLRQIHPKLPEFDETVNWVINKYKNIKITNNMRAY